MKNGDIATAKASEATDGPQFNGQQSSEDVQKIIDMFAEQVAGLLLECHFAQKANLTRRGVSHDRMTKPQ